MVAYIIIVVGRVQDIVPVMHVFPMAKIVAALAIIVAVQSRPTLSSVSIWSLRPARFTILMMGLVAVSILFSVLKHATLGTIMGTSLSVCVGLVLMIKSAVGWNDIRKLLFACVIAALVLALSVEITRYGSRGGNTGDLDPNDFAFVLDGLLPILITFALVSGRLKRLCYTGASIWVILEILRTESRGGLLGLLCVVSMMIVLMPGKQRGRLLPHPSIGTIAARIAILVMAGVLAWHAMPQSARVRFETLRHPDSGYNTNLNDPTGRFSIWLQTLPLALQRPWGWGAGAFNTVDGKFGGGRYKAAHNMYLQALIELGIVGLILFLAALFSSIRNLQSEAFAFPLPVDRDELERRAFARAMLAGFLGICVSGFFLAELYSQAIWTLVILSCLVGRSSRVTRDEARPSKRHRHSLQKPPPMLQGT